MPRDCLPRSPITPSTSEATTALLPCFPRAMPRATTAAARVPYDGYLGLEGAWGTRSSRFLVLKYRAPTIFKGWRIAADAGAVREGRFGYYGQGPDGQGATVDPKADVAAEFFRVHRTRYY